MSLDYPRLGDDAPDVQKVEVTITNADGTTASYTLTARGEQGLRFAGSMNLPKMLSDLDVLSTQLMPSVERLVGLRLTFEGEGFDLRVETT